MHVLILLIVIDIVLCFIIILGYFSVYKLRCYAKQTVTVNKSGDNIIVLSRLCSVPNPLRYVLSRRPNVALV